MPSVLWKQSDYGPFDQTFTWSGGPFFVLQSAIVDVMLSSKTSFPLQRKAAHIQH